MDQFQADRILDRLGSKERATPRAEVRCGCRLSTDSSLNPSPQIRLTWVYCPLHNAASELLAVLKEAVQHCEGWRELRDDQTAVPYLPKILEDSFRDAIAKAEGAPAAHFTESPGTPDPPPTYPSSDEGLAYQAINRLARFRIGVHDYESCVRCLRTNYKLVFGEDSPLTDPQDMIQRLAAEIQNLRREKDA